MAAIDELIAVVEHLVNTHTHWNMDLSKDEALAKLAIAKLGDVPPVVDAMAHVVSDVEEVTKAAEQ